jgi:hypothetical protein
MRILFRALLFSFLVPLPALASPSLKIPARRPGAITGTEFIKATRHLDEATREKAIEAEIVKGNVPSFVRALKPVKIGSNSTVWVTPDYLAIGSDRDFVRIPMSPVTAQRLADRFGAMLPTPKLVDEINRQATVKLAPSPMTVRGAKMTANDAYLRHHQLIERQRRGATAGALTSGHKKDVVLTNRLVSRPYQVAIYGWHRQSGKAIQPLSLVHHNMYADYSHGVRLVARDAVIAGKPTSLDKALSDARYARLASYEGRMQTTRALTSTRADSIARRGKANGKRRPARFARYNKYNAT